MKYLERIGIWSALVALIFLAAPKPATAQNTQNFTISSFTADYYLDRNQAKTSTLHTLEQITAEFPAYDQNHGILRAIPKTYLNNTLSLQIDSVTDENNNPLHYTTSSQNGNLVLKIGDAGSFVHGQRTYKITYDEKNVATILGDHDEFYWDVNGDQWQQPFAQVTARLHVPPSLVNNLQARRGCFVGSFGSDDASRCTSKSQGDSGGVLITYQANSLGPGETMTVVNGFSSGTFVLGPEIAAAKRAEKIKIAAIVVGILALPIISFAYLYRRWYKYGRDPKGRGVIIPEYQPPAGLNALSSDFVFREQLNNKAITSLIIELAIRKFVNIYEIKQKKRLQKDTTTYKLELMKAPAGLTDDEVKVLRMYFDSLAVGSSVDLAELKNKLSSDVSSLKKLLGKQLLAGGYFRNNPNSAGTWYYTIGSLAALGGFLVLSFVYLPAGISVGLAGLVFLAFARYMPARSDLGAQVRDHMLGLRDYIKLAEADRIKFLQSPQGAEKIKQAGLEPSDPQFKVKLFESLLPYAMLFNLEKDWAKQFQDVYTQPPNWYSGNWGTFNAAYLASSLGGFNTASAVSFVSPSSGGSGFSGGFSGGGGGGGGGGGW